MPNQYIKNVRVNTEINDTDVSSKIEEIKGLADIDYGESTQYSDEEKIRAVVTWILTRNLNRVHRETGLKMHTLRYWKYNTKWWKECEAAIKSLRNEDLDRKLSDIIDYSLDEIFDRLEKGDEVVYNGEVYRKKVSAKDIMTILGITYDKRALIRGDPTSRIERNTNEDKINQLAERFEKIAKEQNAWLEAPKAERVDEGKTRTDSVDDIEDAEYEQIEQTKEQGQ